MRKQLRFGCGFVVVMLLSFGTAIADALEVDFNSDDFRAAYTLAREQKGLEFDFEWMHGSEKGDIGSAGLHVLGLTGRTDSPIVAGVGGKLLFIDVDPDSGSAAALGGYVTYRLKRLERLELKAQIYFAPGVLAFSDVDSYFEAGVRAAYQVHERASVYLGWRTVEADYESAPSTKVNDGLHIGLRLGF